MSEERKLNETETQILDAIQMIRFGTVEVVIHDSRVVQIERSEKIRFEAKTRHTSSA
ncbi:MAG: hypothetical protein Dbin4_01368 [Alphaproteobacteria bacterium]|nr:hypothetical protein [Alphaproteobacteria bacterium]